MAPNANKARMPRRPFGQTDIELSVIGFGGIVVKDMAQPEADRIVAEAVGQGVNYFDVAPTYGDAEDRLGPALEPFREQCFLACKTIERTRAGAARGLTESLKRLRTDHVDLYQLHGLGYKPDDDVDGVFAKGGALEALIEAREAGRIRYIGFSAHTEAAALAALDRFDFDSVMFPLNFACWLRNGFGRAVLERAVEKGVAVLALKALGRQPWPENAVREPYGKCWYQPVSDPREASLALRFTLSLPVAAAPRPGEAALLRLAMAIAQNLEPLTLDEVAELEALAQRVTPLFPK